MGNHLTMKQGKSAVFGITVSYPVPVLFTAGHLPPCTGLRATQA